MLHGNALYLGASSDALAKIETMQLYFYVIVSLNKDFLCQLLNKKFNRDSYLMKQNKGWDDFQTWREARLRY